MKGRRQCRHCRFPLPKLLLVQIGSLPKRALQKVHLPAETACLTSLNLLVA